LGLTFISRDTAGLEKAAMELLEEWRTREERERLAKVAAGAANREALEASLGGSRTLPEAYYPRAIFLLELDELVQGGLPVASLTLAEWHGVRAVRSARAQWEAQHPPCPDCGELLASRHALACRCGWRRQASQRGAA